MTAHLLIAFSKNFNCCYNYGDPRVQQIKWVSNGNAHISLCKDLQGQIRETDHNIKLPSAIPITATPIPSLLNPTTLNATIPSQVLQIIQTTHQSIDEITTRYFNGLHLWIPFLDSAQFHKDLLESHSLPTPDFSILLLSMCLLTYDPTPNHPLPIDHDTLYLHAKTLFTQTQVSQHPSIHSIHAGIFVSMYEYAHGRADAALASIDICARTAYKLGLDRPPECAGGTQAWNTWWAIRILERVFYCETSSTNIPLVSSSPKETNLLPREISSSASEEVSRPSGQIVTISTAGIGVGCLARAAQAAYLLDRVFQSLKISPATDRITVLLGLDTELQRLLSTTISKCHDHRGGHCGAVCISIRSVATLLSPLSTNRSS